MSKLRSCGLCGAAIGQNVAAHPCPHGEACHYALNAEGLPLDWRTPSCMECQLRFGLAAAEVRLGLTEKALELLEGD